MSLYNKMMLGELTLKEAFGLFCKLCGGRQPGSVLIEGMEEWISYSFGIQHRSSVSDEFVAYNSAEGDDDPGPLHLDASSRVKVKGTSIEVGDVKLTFFREPVAIDILKEMKPETSGFLG